MPHLAFLDAVHPTIRAEIVRRLPADWHLSCTASNVAASRQTAAADADVAMIIGTGIDAALLDGAPRLRFVQKLGAGVDNVDAEACRKRHVAVARLEAANASQVAEHTIMLMLAALRRLTYFDRETRSGRWLRAEGRGTQRQLEGKTVGLVGLGAIGREVARRLVGFGVETIYYDIRRPGPELEARLQVRYHALDDLLRHSDVVSLHLPLTPETCGLLGARRLRLLKSGSTIINCARGGLIDQLSLCEALERRVVFAAALDTFDEEPLRSSPLFERDDVIVTPHVAGATVENFVHVFQRGLSNIHLFLAGSALPPGELVIGA